MENQILDTHDNYPEAEIFETPVGDYGDCPYCDRRFNAAYIGDEENEGIEIAKGVVGTLIIGFAVVGFIVLVSGFITEYFTI